jgi:protein-tyrosine kinase
VNRKKDEIAIGMKNPSIDILLQDAKKFLPADKVYPNDNKGIDQRTGDAKTQSMGTLLVDAGKVSPVEIEQVLRIQKEQGLRFGDAAKMLGLVTENDIQQVLARQFDFPFLENGYSELSPELIAAYQPFTEPVEILRAIRSQLLLRWFDDTRKVLAVVSPERGEGRSYLTANLAIVFSQLGERTLLIDADMRQSRQHQLFNLQQTQGLSDYLAGRVDSAVISRIPDFPDLSVLPAGTTPPNPLELISRNMTTCLEKLSQDYDVILLDTPASEHCMDTQVLASKAGGALLLARRHKSRFACLEKLKYSLGRSGTVCAGSVVVDF